MVELVAERGYAGVTIRALVRTSEVSTSAFYRQFPDIEECFASTYRTIMQRVRERLTDLTAANRRREDLLRSSVQAIIGAAAKEPHVARLALVDCYDGGPAMLREIEVATREVELLLAEGPAAIPAPLGQGIVAGVESVVRSKVLERREVQLTDLAAEVADWAVRVAALGPRSKPHPKVESQERWPRVTGRDPGFAAFAALGGDRGRILAAVAKLSADGGYWNLTLPSVRREAGVSRKNFDALFADLDHSYLEMIETLATAAARAAANEANESLAWPAGVEDLVGRFCEQIARSPLLARLAFVDVFAPGSAGLRCRDRLLSRAVHLLRAAAPRDRAPREPAMEAAVSASWRVLQAEIKATGTPLRPASPALAVDLILASAGDDSANSPIYGNRERAIPRTGDNGTRAR
ncbi:MAG: TetR family transcriptional regulator [Solirubrobacterales bacterium]